MVRRYEVETGETSIFVRWSGSGATDPAAARLPANPPDVAWRRALGSPAASRSSVPTCAATAQAVVPRPPRLTRPTAKRAMARDMVAVMERLGFPRFSVAGHDRGGRVAYRLALDHPGPVERLAVLDVLPTGTVWERADARFALAYWPWSLLAQPEPLPERLIQAAPEAVVDDALAGWGSPSTVFGPEVRAAYVDRAAGPRPCPRHLRGVSGRRDPRSGARRRGPRERASH